MVKNIIKFIGDDFVKQAFQMISLLLKSSAKWGRFSKDDVETKYGCVYAVVALILTRWYTA